MSRTEGVFQTGPVPPLPSWEDAHRMERASRVEGHRRTAEAQDQINAARANPTDAELEAQLSDAALQATPAVKQYGCSHTMEGSCPKCTPTAKEAGSALPPDADVVRGSIRAWRRPGGNIGIDTTHTVGGLMWSGEGRPHIVIERADVDDAIAALQVLAGTPPPGGHTPILPPGAVVLTGPEAERYRALQAAALKAQESARAAKSDGAALLQLFQAFCAGIAP